MKSQVERNQNQVQVGDVLTYSDASNYQKWEVTELFDGGFVAKDDFETETFFFNDLQIGWEFSESTKANRGLTLEEGFNKSNPYQIKQKLEAETGLKVSMKVNSLKSSMRGYITFTAKKQGGEFKEWSFRYTQQLTTEFEAPEPHPSFCNKYTLSVYFGDEAYNYVKKAT